MSSLPIILLPGEFKLSILFPSLAILLPPLALERWRLSHDARDDLLLRYSGNRSCAASGPTLALTEVFHPKESWVDYYMTSRLRPN